MWQLCLHIRFLELHLIHEILVLFHNIMCGFTSWLDPILRCRLGQAFFFFFGGVGLGGWVSRILKSRC